MKQISLLNRVFKLAEELDINLDSIYAVSDLFKNNIIIGSYIKYIDDNEKWLSVIMTSGVTDKYCITGDYDVMCTIAHMKSHHMPDDIICQVIAISSDKLNEYLRMVKLITGGGKGGTKRRISQQERRTGNSR